MRRDEPVHMEEIVEMAASLFEERGFNRTRAEDIADALGIAKPTLYTRTSGKAQLLEAVIERVTDALSKYVEEVTQPEMSPFETLGTLFRHHVVQAIRHRAYFNVFFSDGRELTGAARARIDGWSREITLTVADLVQSAIDEGQIDSTVNPRIAANTHLAAANWVCRWYKPDGPLTPEEIAESSWLILAHGMSTRGDVDPVG